MNIASSVGRRAVRIDLEDIVVRFGPLLAADHVSLAIEPGEIVALLGPSGCGKTTTLRVIAGLQDLQEGALRFDGAIVNDVPPHKRKVGMVFQNYALFPHMTVRENVLFGLQMHGCPRGERAGRVDRILDLLQIAELARSFPDQLSGGQQQRAALARTLVVEPAVLLLDEPLSALDRQLRDAMRAELRSLLKAVNITTVIVTHDQDEALTLADRVAVMRKGRIEQIGVPAEIYGKPATRFVASFIGQTNYVPGRIERSEGDIAEVRIAEDLMVRAAQAGRRAPGDAVELAIRPEAIAMAAESQRDLAPTDANVAPAMVERSVFLGGLTTYHLRLPGGCEIVVSQTPNARAGRTSAPQPGDRVLLSWPVESTTVLREEGRA
ncbi:MAG: putative spermidine/putrescine transport system ATP-binding protein [Rhodospirillaceae bacterium]|jgi:putative spermidine/putrescine transport system ATP-binding protein|nr:putative spermidine/putrescine transport system ATP-binding protein [Rhodospirillaceae bacterium]